VPRTAKEMDERRKLRNRLIVAERKKSGCAICGEKRFPCLDMHHIEEKKYSINRLVQEGATLERLLAELAKCIVLCANCHRVVHGTGPSPKP
jgi:hypothetical protein